MYVVVFIILLRKLHIYSVDLLCGLIVAYLGYNQTQVKNTNKIV